MTSLVFPTYNPGPGIERTWHAVRDFVRGRAEPWEVIFVLDGCTDGTDERLESLARYAPDSRLHVVSYSHNRGKGFAVRTGFAAARGESLIFTDVDLQFWDGLERVHRTLHNGADAVCAARTHPESRLDLPSSSLRYVVERRVQSAVFNRIARALLPISLGDTQAGLKGFSARAANAILPELKIDGFGFDCEWLTACARLGYPVEEIPLTFRYDTATSTTARASTVLKMVGELWRIRREWKRSKRLPSPAIPSIPVPYRSAA